MGTVGELWMLALTVLTALNTFNGGFLVASRFIYAAARENNLPRQFARLNVNAVPWLAVTTLTVVSGIVAAVVFATGQWLLLVSGRSTIARGSPSPLHPRRRATAGQLRRRLVQRPVRRHRVRRSEKFAALFHRAFRGNRHPGGSVERLRALLRPQTSASGRVAQRPVGAPSSAGPTLGR